MTSSVEFSIIIPVRIITPYLRETLSQLKKQSFKNFEVLVITDKISGNVSPAIKRNLGAKKARGKYLAFLDDDSYPLKDWLKQARPLFTSNIAAVCGPCLTPPTDNPRQQASGLVWSSYLGSGGAGSYRNQISSSRFVDDYPSVNLIVKKTDFEAVGGFNTHHWPGEDTILCHDLVYRLGKKILYYPEVVVYHHRRQAIIPHLQQITRYALHRGNFARIYPRTSLRPGYLLPSFFLLYLVFLLFLLITNHLLLITLLPLYLYFILLLLTFFKFQISNCKLKIAALAAITIPITHLYYGALFIIGFFTPQLGFQSHKIDHQGYSGG